MSWCKWFQKEQHYPVKIISSLNLLLLGLLNFAVNSPWKCTRLCGLNSLASSSFYWNKSWSSLIICYGKRSHQREPTCLNFFFFSIEEFTKPFAILLSVLLKHGILYFHRFFSILFQYTPATKILYSVPWATYKNLVERVSLCMFSALHRSKCILLIKFPKF